MTSSKKWTILFNVICLPMWGFTAAIQMVMRHFGPMWLSILCAGFNLLVIVLTMFFSK